VSCSKPHAYLDRIEAQQVTPLEVRDATLSDQPAHVSNRHPEVRGDLVDVDQARQLVSLDGRHAF